MADGAGRIINMSSIIASTGYNGLSVYGATKAAATGFTRSLAREVGKLGITVNAIAPGFVDTELTQGLSDDAAQAHRRPQRVAPACPRPTMSPRMVEYLLGEGGRNITGTRADHRRRQYGLIACIPVRLAVVWPPALDFPQARHAHFRRQTLRNCMSTGQVGRCHMNACCGGHWSRSR